MTTARTVPVTIEMDGDELDAEDAWRELRQVGVRRLFVDAFVRFRYGDGFTLAARWPCRPRWPSSRSCSP